VHLLSLHRGRGVWREALEAEAIAPMDGIGVGSVTVDPRDLSGPAGLSLPSGATRCG